jgi:hypothetical protein
MQSSERARSSGSAARSQQTKPHASAPSMSRSYSGVEGEGAARLFEASTRSSTSRQNRMTCGSVIGSRHLGAA